MNISPVKNNLSFKSNYKMPLDSKTSDAIDSLYKFHNRGIEVYEKFDSKITSSDSFGQVIIDADDRYDDKIEAMLISRGINFNKKSKNEIMGLDDIFSRISLSDSDEAYGRKLLILDTDKVERLFRQNPFDTYIGPHGSNGIGDRYNQFIEYLKTGQDIDASKIHLSETPDGLCLNFIDGRHRFSVLRDMWMEKIPFAMDEKSAELAQKYNLLA